MAGLLGLPGRLTSNLHASNATSFPSNVVLPRRSRTASAITCMAHPRRVARVAKQIEREVGSLLIYDKVLQKAVCPERRRGLDGAVSALASVTEVQISNDLQVAKVFLSIYSDEAGKEAAIMGLQRLEGYVRKHIGRAIRLRLTPEIRFIMDESIERTEQLFKKLELVRAIQAGEAPPPPIAIPEDLAEEDEDQEIDFGAVDLGMFDDEEEDEEYGDEEGDIEVSVSSRTIVADSKASETGLSNEEVEEMMALFRQESAVSSGRRKTGGGGGGGSGGGGRRGGRSSGKGR